MAAIRLTRPTALVLAALGKGLRHGFDIIDATGLPSGTVYPILHRLEHANLVRAQWESVIRAREEQRPPRRYYELTAGGKTLALEAQVRARAMAEAGRRLLRPVESEG